MCFQFIQLLFTERHLCSHTPLVTQVSQSLPLRMLNKLSEAKRKVSKENFPLIPYDKYNDRGKQRKVRCYRKTTSGLARLGRHKGSLKCGCQWWGFSRDFHQHTLLGESWTRAHQMTYRRSCNRTEDTKSLLSHK